MHGNPKLRQMGERTFNEGQSMFIESPYIHGLVGELSKQRLPL